MVLFPHVFLLSYVLLVLLWLWQKKTFLCHNYNWIHFISIHVQFITYDFYIWIIHITMCNTCYDWIKNIFSLRVRTLFSSTIPHFLWFQWQSNHLLIHRWLEDFVLFVLWDPSLSTWNCYNLLLCFPIVVNNSNWAVKSPFDKSFKKLAK